MIVIGVPLPRQDRFHGALLGAINLHNMAIDDPVRRLRVGDDGFAYLVDANECVISPPTERQIGADFSDRPFVARVIAGQRERGLPWPSSTGELAVFGHALLEDEGLG